MNRCGGLVLLALLWCGVTKPCRADSVLDRAEPEARKRFESLASSYHSLNYYKDEGVFTRTVKINDLEHEDKSPVVVRFSSPNLLVLQAAEIEIVGDGKTMNTILYPTRRFLQEKSPEILRFNRISDGPAGAILFGGMAGPSTQLLLKLLLREPVASALPDRTSAIKQEGSRDWQGQTYDCLLLEQGDEPSLRVYIDPATNLIRRMEYVFASSKLSDMFPVGSGLEGMSLAWDSGQIVTMNPDKLAFEFKKPEGYQRVEAAKPKATPDAEKNPLVGKVSPDFRLEILDGPGKTRQISRADLTGKIVILDFWATWCGPCLIELPEIQSLATEIAQAKHTDVVIVAVSQDRQPEEGGSPRKLVEELLAARNLSLAEGPISHVALDPDQISGELFGVEALPTLVVIDSKGLVQAVHVGYEEGIKDVLLDQIGHLREGKPLSQAPAPK